LNVKFCSLFCVADAIIIAMFGINGDWIIQGSISLKKRGGTFCPSIETIFGTT
jgi:hypothetical protein